MKTQYRVSGRYLARYPDGHTSGDVGISAHIKAKNETKAKDDVASKTMRYYGYTDFRWLDVQVWPEHTLKQV